MRLIEQLRWWASECDRTNNGCQTRKLLREAAEAIENLSAASLRPKGEWEWQGGIPWCSNCGKMPSGYSYDGDVSVTDFCPNCGADMRGE